MHDKSLERSVDEIAETLKNAKRTNRGATLLIGAGCSASADIPLASDFVRMIREMFPARCKRLASNDYAQHMAELGDGERHDLIVPNIDKKRVNWAHMAIAQMMKHGYVGRILTTNFDPLIIQACAIAGIFPAVYDLASSSIFKPAQVRDPSVFYLHGQRLGFVMLNTNEQVRSHFDTLKPVFDRAGEGRVWIVAGYSGVNDPVFSHMAAVDHFGHNLYWVGFRDEEPATHVAELISRQRCAYYVRGYDADRFFVDLARALGCFPPEIVSKPFSHLVGYLDLLLPFTLTTESSQDLKEAARTRIQKAIDAFETGEPYSATDDLRPEALDAMSLLLAGKTDEVLALYEASPRPSDELRDAAAWAHIPVGDALSEQAKALARVETGRQEADRLWKEACRHYAEAVRIEPKRHEALNNWGNTLDDWARSKTGEEADGLWQQAFSRYGEAVQIKPDQHDALNNWGVALMAWAATKTGEEADRLLEQACTRYAEAVHIKPDKHQTLKNWAAALMRRSFTSSPTMRAQLFAEGEQKCRLAEELMPGSGSYNLACAYALRDDAENCRSWLSRSKEHGYLPKRETVLGDPDLAPFRDEPWFQEIIGPP